MFVGHFHKIFGETKMSFTLFPKSVHSRTALLVYVMLPMVLTLGLVGYIALNSIEKQVEKQMQKDLELVARAVQLPLSYALEKDRMGSIQQSLESVFAIGRVYSAYVFDSRGKRIVNLGLAEPENQRKRLTELAADGQNRGEYEQIAGREVYSYFLPLTNTGGRINGLLQLTRKESEFSENFHTLRINGAILLTLLMVLLSGVVLYGHHQAIGTHLGRLTDSMTRIAGGDHRHRFAYSGPKEIVALGKTFNHMLNSMDDAQRTILKHRKKQDELEKQVRQNEKLAALGRFAAGTAHELGTPLSTISGRAQRALRAKDLHHDLRQALNTIRREVGRMEYIIKLLLDFSRRNPLRCSAVDVSWLVESAVATMEEEARMNKAQITCVTPDAKTVVLLDSMRVQQALVNLVKNAVQSTPGATVCITCRHDHNNILFCVDDDGPGVTRENRAKIFDPFFTTKSAGKGTGLGLSVVHAAAQEHGGTVALQDSHLGGACFILQIPLQNPEIQKEKENTNETD
jgi:two-component system, NtrC family, sensor kinase